MLNATLPRIIQRRILRMLPPELGRYLLDAGRPVNTHGEIGAPRASSWRSSSGASHTVLRTICKLVLQGQLLHSTRCKPAQPLMQTQRGLSKLGIKLVVERH